MTITAVGLGPGPREQVTPEAQEALASAHRVYLRTRRHPAARHLPGARSFDSLLRRLPPGEALGQMTEALLQAGDGVVYATPGHPLVGEAVVAALKRQTEVSIVAGLSPWETAAQALGLDPAQGLAVADALDPRPDPARPTLIVHLAPALIPSLREALLQRYPPHHRATLVAPGRRPRTLSLEELAGASRGSPFLYLPALPPEDDLGSMVTFQAMVARLRGPGGCPWDREQTHSSLREFVLEETYEVLEALDEGNPAQLQEELGDLLLQIVLHSQIAQESGEFALGDVVRGIARKLLHRHPHVFGEVKVAGADDVVANWERLKEEERGEGASLLSSVPRALPALAYSQAIQERAARVGFEWPEYRGILEKVGEELQELQEARAQGHRAHELGDILFALGDVGRWLGVDLESALRQANQRFARRFRYLETACQRQGRKLSALTFQEQNALWDEAKRALGDRETP